MTDLLGKPRERSCLSHDECRHRQATGNKFVLQPLNKGVILIRRCQSAIGLLGTNLIANLGKTAGNTLLLAPFNQINRTPKNNIQWNDLANFKGILSRINHQEVKAVKHICQIRLAGEFHSFVFGQMGIALLVPLPRTAMISAQIIQAIKANFLSYRRNICREALLIPAVNISTSQIIAVNLIARCNEHQREVVIAAKFKGCLKEIGRHGSDAKKRRRCAGILQPKEPFNGSFDGQFLHKTPPSRMQEHPVIKRAQEVLAPHV